MSRASATQKPLWATSTSMSIWLRTAAVSAVSRVVISFFSKYASTGDGILTSLKMMEVMLAKKMPMSKLAEPLKIYPQVLENVRVTDKKAAQNDPAVQEAVKAVAEALGDSGRILVRESGTEPVVRVMVEAPDHDTRPKELCLWFWGVLTRAEATVFE